MNSTIQLPVWVQALDGDDLQFLKRFLLGSGSLKALAEEYGVSYPTVRGRLDRLIAKIGAAEEARSADPFERLLKVLAADAKITGPVARELLEAHRATTRKGV